MFVGTFIEEIISPIPSFLVLIPTGAAAQDQGYGFEGLLWLAVLSAVSRLLAGTILYWLGAKFEKSLFSRGRKLFGVTHKDIQKLSKQLGGRKSGLYVLGVLFLMHATPVFPGTFLSLGSGFIKLKFWIFATATFFGSIVNAMFYMWIGFMGMHAARLLDGLGAIGEVITFALIVTAIVLWYRWTRHKKQNV